MRNAALKNDPHKIYGCFRCVFIRLLATNLGIQVWNPIRKFPHFFFFCLTISHMQLLISHLKPSPIRVDRIDMHNCWWIETKWFFLLSNSLFDCGQWRKNSMKSCELWIVNCFPSTFNSLPFHSILFSPFNKCSIKCINDMSIVHRFKKKNEEHYLEIWKKELYFFHLS